MLNFQFMSTFVCPCQIFHLQSSKIVKVSLIPMYFSRSIQKPQWCNVDGNPGLLQSFGRGPVSA